MTSRTHATFSSRPSRPGGLAVLASVALLTVTLAAPADAQRRPTSTRDAPTKQTTRSKAQPTAIEYATARRRARDSADRVAVTLTRTYRLKSSEVARTMIRAGYDAGPTGRALVDGLKASPQRAAADLERAGVRNPRELYGALLQMTRTRPDALKVMRALKGSRTAIAVIRAGGEEETPTAEEAAQDMDEAGFSLEEIVEVLMSDPYGLSAEDLLALFLELNLADPNNEPATYELLREKGLDAREAATAATNAGVGSDALASILASAGYTWDEIVDALEWAGETALDAARIAVDAGAPLADMVRWLLEEERGTIELIFDAFHEHIEFVMGIMLEMSDTQTEVLEASTAAHDAGMSLDDVVDVLMDHGLSAAEIAEVLHDAGHDAETIAAALIANGIDALTVALALDDIGESIEDVVRALKDHVSPEQIAAILAEMQVTLAKRLEILTTIVGLSHDTAMAIIGKI